MGGEPTGPCSSHDGYAHCNFRRTDRLGSCREPGGCLESLPAARQVPPSAAKPGRPGKPLLRVGRLLFLIALGPITGPLGVGMLSCLARRRWAMAGVYGAAIVEAWGVLACAAGVLAAYARSHAI